MPETKERNAGSGDVPIRDAACLILVDRGHHEARMLMGRRHAAQVFLPNKWVFPGGRVDEGDRVLARAALGKGDLRERERRPFALAAVRETFEETGLLVCAADRGLADPPQGWRTFASAGGTPDVDGLIPVARAVTPPGLPRRFDTWFFLAEWDARRFRRGQPDGELLDIDWFTIAQARGLELPIITRRIVDDVAMRLDRGASEGRARIPFYFQDKDLYRRELIEI